MAFPFIRECHSSAFMASTLTPFPRRSLRMLSTLHPFFSGTADELNSSKALISLCSLSLPCGSSRISRSSLSSLVIAVLTCLAEGFRVDCVLCSVFFLGVRRVAEDSGASDDGSASRSAGFSCFSSFSPYISSACFLTASEGELISAAASLSACRTENWTFSVGFSIYRIFNGLLLTAASCTTSEGSDTYLSAERAGQKWSANGQKATNQ